MTRKRRSYDIPIDTGDEDVTPSADEVEESPEATLDHLRRLQAEFANYRRRTDRERMEAGVWAQSRLVERLLPILDDFDRATATAEEGESASQKGFQLIREKLHRTLTEAGLERIDVDGAVFDPERHEALLTQQVEPDLAGRVLHEIEPGYLFKGRLVRPARVQVGIASDE